MIAWSCITPKAPSFFSPSKTSSFLSRFGSDETEVELDRLGGAGWQKRKARMRKRVLEMAAGLIKIAAERQMRAAPKLVPPEGLYDEFCAGFPYDETEDQQAAIDAKFWKDMASGRPMDRLVLRRMSVSARPRSPCSGGLRWLRSKASKWP